MLFDSWSKIAIHDDSKIFVLVELGRGLKAFPVFPLLDTGATGTMVPKWIAEELGIDYEKGQGRRVNGISGHLQGRVHKVDVALMDDEGKEVGRNVIDVTFVEGSDLSIAGMNLLARFDWNLVFSRKTIEVRHP